MAWKGIVGVGMTLPEFKLHVEGLQFRAWRPSFCVLHNTGAPTLAQWHSTPGEQRMKNLTNYYVKKGWSAGPHVFVADDKIWPFTPFTTQGVHSPSWNGLAIGVEAVGDFAREDDDSGPGLRVKKNCIAVMGLLHMKLGLDPNTMRLHREDKRTDHACPGTDLAQDKLPFIQSVIEFMGEGGEHPMEIPINETPDPVSERKGRVANVPEGDHLNLRETSSASSKIVTELHNGDVFDIFGTAMNGKTKWLRVAMTITGHSGWINARYASEG